MSRLPDAHRLLDRVRRNRRDMLRIALQTAIATAAIYFVMSRLDPANLSWAVMAGLFTIGLSADATYTGGLGRIVGAFLGVALGLAATWAIAPVVIGLVIAAVAANAVATLWPGLRYAAATAAMVALNPQPEVGGSLSLGLAVLLGTLIAAGVCFVAWPAFGRQRVRSLLQAGLDDCKALLDLIAASTDTDERRQRDARHARFLRRLQAAHARLDETRFQPTLPNGTGLGRAVSAIESLWHAIVILDRAVSDERRAIGQPTMARLAPGLDAVQQAAAELLDGLAPRLRTAGPPPPTGRFTRRVAEARAEAQRAAAAGSDERQRRGLDALVFALEEIEASLLQFADAVAPDQAGGDAARAA